MTPSRLLGSLPGLAVHRVRRPVASWGTGVVAYFLLIGLLTGWGLDSRYRMRGSR